MTEEVDIDGRPVGSGRSPFVVAELSANHGGSLDRAIALVREAAACGADAVKLQTYTPDTMTLDRGGPPFEAGPGTIWHGRRLYELYAEAQTPWEWHRPLADAALEAGITWFSTPFDRSSVEFLDGVGVPAYKVASFELVDTELVALVAATGKPVILSTGMASVEEIELAVATAREAGSGGIVLLRCSSAYPAPLASLDLQTIPDMVRRWDVPVGFSDHTEGALAATAATALGACMVEKHLTLDRRMGGPDSAFSCEPDELRQLVVAVHEAAAARGGIRYGPSASEQPSLPLRRSLWFVADVEAGRPIPASAVRALRPADGLAPRHRGRVIGRPAARPIAAGSPVTWEDVGGRPG